jgi:hypothetical protein
MRYIVCCLTFLVVAYAAVSHIQIPPDAEYTLVFLVRCAFLISRSLGKLLTWIGTGSTPSRRTLITTQQTTCPLKMVIGVPGGTGTLLPPQLASFPQLLPSCKTLLMGTPSVRWVFSGGSNKITRLNLG